MLSVDKSCQQNRLVTEDKWKFNWKKKQMRELLDDSLSCDFGGKK